MMNFSGGIPNALWQAAGQLAREPQVPGGSPATPFPLPADHSEGGFQSHLQSWQRPAGAAVDTTSAAERPYDRPDRPDLPAARTGQQDHNDRSEEKRIEEKGPEAERPGTVGDGRERAERARDDRTAAEDRAARAREPDRAHESERQSGEANATKTKKDATGPAQDVARSDRRRADDKSGREQSAAQSDEAGAVSGWTVGRMGAAAGLLAATVADAGEHKTGGAKSAASQADEAVTGAKERMARKAGAQTADQPKTLLANLNEDAQGLARFLRQVSAAAGSEKTARQQRNEKQAGVPARVAERDSNGANQIDSRAAEQNPHRIELDSAKWQIHGRVYGERNGSETTETKLEAVMDRYVKGARSRESGKEGAGSEGGQSEGRGDGRNFAGRLNDLQSIGGEMRETSARDALDLSRQKEELARENRRLFNDLVERARVNVQSNGNSTASIRMNPAALGRMTLNLEVHQNQVHARIVVETDAARRLMMDELEGLRQELSRQGITVESLNVRVREPASMSFMSGSNANANGEGSVSGQNPDQNQGSDPQGSDGQTPDEPVFGDQSYRRDKEQAGEDYELVGAVALAAGAGAARGVNISI